MTLKKPVHRYLVSILLVISLLLSLSLPAFAAGHGQEKSTRHIQYKSGTTELIEKTISELSVKGEVYTPKTDKALEREVKQISGLSLGVVKTYILFGLFSNYEDGWIDTARFGLDAETLAKALNMTLKEFALDSAVDIVNIESNDNGIGIGIVFEMRSSFKAGLDEISSFSNEEAAASDPSSSVNPDKVGKDGSNATLFGATAVSSFGDNHAFYWVATEDETNPWTCWAVFIDENANLDFMAECVVVGPNEGVYNATYEDVGTSTAYNAPAFTPPISGHECSFSSYDFYWTAGVDTDGNITSYTACTAFGCCSDESCGASVKADLTVTPAEPTPPTATEDGVIVFTASDETGEITDERTVVVFPSGIWWTADFNWNYRYVADYTNQVGLVFRDDGSGVKKIQTAPTDDNGYYLTKIEFYLESITLNPMYSDGKPAGDAEPVILSATAGEVLTEGNITTTTYPNGLKVEDLFVDEAYLGSLQAELEAEMGAKGGIPTPRAMQLIDQINALGPCIYSHVLTASFTDPVRYPLFDEELNYVYAETINATEQAVYQYYAELCDFNAAFPNHFGSAANFWTSKDVDDPSNGTKILGALKTLANMQPDTFVPFGAYDANQDGQLDMQKEIGLDLLISMLTQAFMAYEYQLGSLLDAKIADCQSQIRENMTTEQKMLAIHDWLANNAEFDIGVITAMKDGSSGGSDPSQMTAFGTILYDMLGVDGAICLGYAATYYLLLQEVMELDTDENDIVMVRWWTDIAETSVAGSESGFGQGRFNETHYFNAVKLENEWYYIDACYDDIYCEVMTQYRVETDGNISHNYFLFAPTSALNMFDGNIDYIDSAYDGVTFQRRLDLDDNGNVQYENMSPVYETDLYVTDTGEEKEHVIWYHSEYPEAAADADDAENAYLDASIVCNETAYDDTQYEESWFTAAMGEIHCDGKYYYYVAGELNSYAAMTGDDFGSGQGGDYEFDMDLGDMFNNDDPSFADRLVRRSMSDPINATQDSANVDSWSREVEFEVTFDDGSGPQTMTATRDVFVDPYTETIFHYGFGTLGQPQLDSDKTTPIIGEDGSYINDKTGDPLETPYADYVAYDAACMDIYPDIAHTSGVYEGRLYFNVANRIYSLSIADISDWDYTIELLKEYNTVSYYSDGKDFGNEQGSRFTGKTFHLTSDQAQAIGTMTGKPIAAISMEDRWLEVSQQTGINKQTILTVSLGTNLSETTMNEEGNNYRVEAVNYNPDYIAGYSGEDENSNAEFMWCANLVENLLMLDIHADLAAGDEVAVEVTVAPFCVTDGFTEKRGPNTGVSIPGTRVVDEGSALGHDYVWNADESQWICTRCGAVSGETFYLYGDVDENGEVNDIDRTNLARYLAGWSGYEISARASDVNRDGDVNDKDRTILARHLAGWSGYETLPYN